MRISDWSSDVCSSDLGWKGLATLLEALTPSVDTQIPLTASQITDRISELLNQGQNQEALEVIQKRTAQLEQQNSLGTDVQLMFLHGRPLAALGHHDPLGRAPCRARGGQTV